MKDCREREREIKVFTEEDTVSNFTAFLLSDSSHPEIFS